MNYCSFFIKDKALFGSYPNRESFNQLIENNVKVFVDLTTVDERKDLYDYKNDDITYINYQTFIYYIQRFQIII